jgi:hypothetical protein
VLIDRQLVEAGWSVQDKKAMNLFAAQGVAVREVTLKPGPAANSAPRPSTAESMPSAT